jgi:hypothetical protein
VLSFILLLAADSGLVAQTPTPACHSPQQPKEVAELLFGRDIRGKIGVNETAWEHFVARELTPRFPDGLVITEATGQWRDPANGKTVREPAKHVEIVLPGADNDDAQLDAVVKAYKQEFHQRSVGVIVRSACVAF